MMMSSIVGSIFTATALAATTALIMGYTGHSLSPEADPPAFVKQWIGVADRNYISPSSSAATGIPAGPYNTVGVITPEQFLMPGTPGSGPMTYDESVGAGLQDLDNCIKATECDFAPDVGSAAPAADDNFVVFGYSQSATIETLEKRRLAAEYSTGDGPNVSFVLLGNGNRPNGGYLARGPQGFTIPFGFTFGGATFSGPTPTNTQYNTVDVAGQYDPWADAPLNPFNVPARLNAAFSGYVHLNYENVSLTDPNVINQGRYGDTTYYMIATPILPLLQPVKQIPVIGYPLADALDAPLRVLVESGYDRNISPGQPIKWSALYFPNPVAFAADLTVSIPTAFDNALQDTVGIRPFGTERPGPYGVGGPDVTYANGHTATKPIKADAHQGATVESTSKSHDAVPQHDSAAAQNTAETTQTRSAVTARNDIAKPSAHRGRHALRDTEDNDSKPVTKHSASQQPKARHAR
jgi:hypothetical protein